MKTELLIIKSRENYIRFKDDAYHLCSFDKASVFPMNKLDTVNEHIVKLKASGFEDACIKKLIIEERDFE